MSARCVAALEGRRGLRVETGVLIDRRGGIDWLLRQWREWLRREGEGIRLERQLALLINADLARILVWIRQGLRIRATLSGE